MVASGASDTIKSRRARLREDPGGLRLTSLKNTAKLMG